MDQLTPDFYGQNRWNAFPFLGPLDAFTSAIVDAAVTAPGGAQGEPVILEIFDPAGHLQVRAGTVPVVALTDPVAITVFGAYTIWEARTAEGQVSLVFLTTSGPPGVPSGAYEFVPSVISYGPTELVLGVSTGGTEVVGPGEDLTLLDGGNVVLSYATDASGNPEITVTGEFDASQPCVPSTITNLRAVKTINGVHPNANGDFLFTGKGIWMVEKVPGSKTIRISNTGTACCDCEDYLAFFELIRTTSGGMGTAAENVVKAQDAYKQLIAYVRFMLNAPVVGGVLPGETDRIAG